MPVPVAEIVSDSGTVVVPLLEGLVAIRGKEEEEGEGGFFGGLVRSLSN